MRIAIPLYARMTALDAIGPYEVLSRVPGAEVVFTGHAPGEIRTDQRLGLTVDAAFEDVTGADVVLVPGGPGQSALMDDERLRSWLREADASSTWTTSVCTGSLLLAAAGLLDGKRATSHWLALEQLRAFGAEPVAERWVEDGKVITAAGVSAGIDMALELASRLAGRQVAEAIQLGLEYDPQPPFDSGSPAKAADALVGMLRGNSRFVLEG